MWPRDTVESCCGRSERATPLWRANSRRIRTCPGSAPCRRQTIAELHRIELTIEEWNIASVRTAERAGFRREGLLRSHQKIGGRRRDMLIYAVTRVAAA